MYLSKNDNIASGISLSGNVAQNAITSTQNVYVSTLLKSNKCTRKNHLDTDPIKWIGMVHIKCSIFEFNTKMLYFYPKKAI